MTRQQNYGPMSMLTAVPRLEISKKVEGKITKVSNPSRIHFSIQKVAFKMMCNSKTTYVLSTFYNL